MYDELRGCQMLSLRIFRDIPRHPSRTCALDVDVWITDFVNDEHHSNPEVVATCLENVLHQKGKVLHGYIIVDFMLCCVCSF